jgi:predicted Zn finger-like uncharacterized protein
LLTDIIRCPGCSSRYVVPQVKLPPPGRTLRCRTCGQNWYEARVGAANASGTHLADVVAAGPSEPPIPIRPKVQHLLRDERGSYDPFAHRPPFQPKHLVQGRSLMLAALMVLAAFAAYLLWLAT